LRTLFTKKEWELIWKTAGAVLLLVGATAGSLVAWLISIKDERINGLTSQIGLLKEQGGGTNVDAALKEVLVGFRRLSMALPISTFDGKIATGDGTSGRSTPITKLLLEAQELATNGRYDAAEERVNQIDKYWPDFPGACLMRYRILRQKGFLKEAEVAGDHAIDTLVDAVDLLEQVYLFSIAQKLGRGEKAAAEKLYLKMFRTISSGTNHMDSFVATFGYRPSLDQ